MATVGCTVCFRSISSDATVCPYCAAPVAAPLKTAASKTGTWIAAACMIAIGLIVMVRLASNDLPLNPVERMERQQSQAWSVCKQFVEDRLRSPRSAEFGRFTDATIHRIPDDAFRVTSSVDSQNIFGALLRTRFTCTVKPGTGNNWQLVDLKTDGQ